MAVIKAKSATVSVPGLLDLPKAEDGIASIVMESMQAMLLKMALYQCRADYETRRERQKQGIAIAKTKGVDKGMKPDTEINAKIVELCAAGLTIAAVAKKLVVNESQVKLILKKDAAIKAAA
jgi:DNA invertase Pin-like site-specific DNA recombinase